MRGQLFNNDPQAQVKIGNSILIDQVIQSSCLTLIADEKCSLDSSIGEERTAGPLV